MNLTTQKVTSEAGKLTVSPLVELFTIDATSLGMPTPIYYHNNNAANEVWFQGIKYNPYPIDVRGFEFRTAGELARPTMKLGNIAATVSTLCLLYNDLVGAKVIRRRTFARFLDKLMMPSIPAFISYGRVDDGLKASASYGAVDDGVLVSVSYGNLNPGDLVNPDSDPQAEYPPDVFYIDRKVSENRQSVEFELGTSLDVEGIRLPLRTIVANTCAWVYRGAECGFAAKQTVADDDDIPSVQTISNWRGEWDKDAVYVEGDGVSITTGLNQIIFAAKPVTHAAFGGVATRPPNTNFWVQDVCSHRIEGCKLRFDKNKTNATLPFGAFPGTANIST